MHLLQSLEPAAWFAWLWRTLVVQNNKNIFSCLSKTLKFSLFFKQWIFGFQVVIFSSSHKKKALNWPFEIFTKQKCRAKHHLFFPTVAQWEGSLLQKCCQKECPVLQQLLQKIVEKWWMIKEQLNRWVRKTWEKNLFVSKGT